MKTVMGFGLAVSAIVLYNFRRRLRAVQSVVGDAYTATNQGRFDYGDMARLAIADLTLRVEHANRSGDAITTPARFRGDRPGPAHAQSPRP
jgi:hypothetical protein